MPRGSIAKRSAKAIPGGLPPTGPAGGDLAGTYPNPTVDGLQGTSVSAAAPAAGNLLRLTGGVWTPYATPPAYFNALAADVTQNAGGTSTLATQVVAAQGTGLLTFVWSSFSVQSAAGTIGTLFIDVDGVQRVSELLQDPAAVVNRWGALNWAEVLGAGNHTIRLRVNVTLGTVYCRPLAVPNNEFANMTIREQF